MTSTPEQPATSATTNDVPAFGWSGYAELVKMEGTVAHILMGGGCQGCAMSAATLRQGIEVMIAESIPEITEIVDVTDHEAGENPFFE